jgi:hypothetical protein
MLVGFKEHTVIAGPYTVDSWMYMDVHKWKRSFFIQCVNIRGHTVTGRVPYGINPCTIRIHPFSSIESLRTGMVTVSTLSLRWLHGTSQFIYGTYMFDFRLGRSGRKINYVWFFALTPGWSWTTPGAYMVCTWFMTVCHWLSRTITDWRVRDDLASHR